MNPVDLQSILSAVMREQEQWNAEALQDQKQRFAQLIDMLRVANGIPAAITPTEQRNSQPPQLPDIEAYVVDKDNPTHFEDWLKRFEMLLLCAAPKISDKEKAMVLATKLSLSSVSAVSPKTLQNTRTKRQ
jgi:hypothetical protein